MASQITTRVEVVAQNNISEEEAEQLIEKHDAGSLEGIADKMQESVEEMLNRQIFRDADEIPVLDVDAAVTQ
jgi:hypothetical protein